MKRKTCLLLMACAFLATHAGCLVRWLRHPEAEAKVTKTTTIPLRLFAGEILAQVTIDGHTSWFFVDTGAPISAVTPRLVEKISKKRFSALKVRVGGATEGELKARLLRFHGLQVGNVSFKDVVAVELDLSPLEEAMGLEINGILGLSFFADFLLTIDYPNKQLILEEGSLPTANQQDIFAYTLQQGHIALPMKLGDKTQPIIIDTGSNSALDIPDTQEKSLRFKAEPVVSGEALGATGKAIQRSARLDGDLSLGKYTIQTPVVSILNTGEASVGGPLLKSFAITIDQKKKLVRLSREELSSASPPFKAMGAGMTKKGDGWQVITVVPAAAQSGLAAGDVIIQVNDRPTKGMDYSDWEQLVNKQDFLQLVVERGKEKLEVTIPVLVVVP